MRFSDKTYIEMAKNGQIPKIFQPMVSEALAMINNMPKGKLRVIDLCSGIGVLGYLVTKLAKKPVELISIESNDKYCEGIAELGIQPHKITVNSQSLNEVIALIDGADIILGRRCLPEMFSTDPRALHIICSHIAENNKRFIGEGRQLRGTSKHPLKSVVEEMMFFKSAGARAIIKKNNIYIL